MTSTTQLQAIPGWECLRLLGTRQVGRLGFTVGNQPLVLPVNYAIDSGTIILRTGAGAKLVNAPFTKVAFEVDDIDEETREGWSVVVQGVAQDISTSIDPYSEHLRTLAPEPWAAGERDYVLRVVPREVTGRRLGDGR